MNIKSFNALLYVSNKNSNQFDNIFILKKSSLYITFIFNLIKARLILVFGCFFTLTSFPHFTSIIQDYNRKKNVSYYQLKTQRAQRSFFINATHKRFHSLHTQLLVCHLTILSLPCYTHAYLLT